MPQVYDELRRLAAWHLKRMKPGQTITGTVLLHEAYLRLSREQGGPRWANRKQFFAAAAEAMRRFLIDHIRAKTRQKRGGKGRDHADLDEVEVAQPAEDDRVLLVNEALDEFAREDPDCADIVKLRFFAGLTVKEIAQSFDVSTRTVGRQWAYARAWLERHIDQAS